MADILLEVCVDDALGLAAAVAGGADRIELCAALSVGGLTPSVGLMAVAARCGLPCHAMIRPRPGDFVFRAAEVAVMQTDIAAVRLAGLPGVVLGASLPDGRLDRAVLADLLDAAQGMDTTLHRAIDLSPDLEQATETALTMGFRRILSSGGQRTAPEGVAGLARMMAVAQGRLVVMPGSGISVESLPALHDLPLREVHASCAAPLPSGGRALAFGFQTEADKRTDADRVRALRQALARR